MALMLLLAQTVSVGFLALWLTTGLRDNLLYPEVNETFTAEVMDMARLRRDYPDCYTPMAHRRVQSRRLQKLAFRLIVGWELLATLALWTGTLALAAALLGLMGGESARAVALGATLMFTATWAMFLIVGNHFAYWFGHEGAQNTHFQMTLWGTAVMILLATGEVS